jgi:hypothetical protein
MTTFNPAMLWNAPTSLTFLPPIVMTGPGYFMMRTLIGDERFEASPGDERRKALIRIGTGGAIWHAIERTDTDDRPFFTARPIEIQSYRSED